jgi:multidrug efflux pump subunit AcrA (membrane-fusion protein)
MSNLRTIFCGLVVLATFLCGAALGLAQGPTGKLPPRRMPPPIKNPPLRRLPPKREVVTVSTVVGSGEVRPTRYVRLISEVSGRVKEILVESGQEVRKNQELVRIESQSADRKVVTQYAPLAGVVADIPTRVGDTASVNSSAPPLMTIADMSKISVEIGVDETEIPKVTVGQSAKVLVDAFGETEIRGVVIAKAPLPIGMPGASGANTIREFKVTVELREIPSKIRNRLRPGMSATATIAVVIRK